ncbi:MAG: acyl-CoA thioesterase [Chloroflexia bacterium]
MVVEVTFPVRYAEVDAQHVVYYAHHVAWFELGYEALFAALGRPLGEERPLVLEAACRYLAPVRYGETVTVRSQALGAEEGHLWVAHEIVVQGKVRAQGATLLEGAGHLHPVPAPPPPERLADWGSLFPHGREERFPLRVRYAESDPTRGAHFARYLDWFEVGRIAFLHRLGLDYARMETADIPFMIAWAGCRYLSPVHFDREVELAVWVEEVRRRSFALGYRIADEEGAIVAVGRTVQAFVQRELRSTPMPEWVRAVLLEALAGKTSGPAGPVARPAPSSGLTPLPG